MTPRQVDSVDAVELAHVKGDEMNSRCLIGFLDQSSTEQHRVAQSILFVEKHSADWQRGWVGGVKEDCQISVKLEIKSSTSNGFKAIGLEV